MDKSFGGVVWTKHALERLKQRGISQGDAWATWRRPDESRYAKSRGAWVYHRIYGNREVEVVAKQNESPARAGKKEWIILSVWSRNVFEKRREKDSSWKRFFRKIFGFN